MHGTSHVQFVKEREHVLFVEMRESMSKRERACFIRRHESEYVLLVEMRGRGSTL